MTRRTIAILIFALTSAPAWAESIDNPAFASWAKVKKGTVVTLKQSSEFAGQKSESTSISTLVDLTTDVATIELVNVIKAGDMEIKTPPTKVEVKKMTELPPGKKKEDYAKPEGLVDQGTETVTVDGVAYKTKWHSIKLTTGDTEIESKSWTCDDVPGLVVKLESKSKTMGMVSTTTMNLVSVKKP
jgi:hypothetical protein